MKHTQTTLALQDRLWLIGLIIECQDTLRMHDHYSARNTPIQVWRDLRRALVILGFDADYDDYLWCGDGI